MSAAELSADHSELRRLSARLREALAPGPASGGGLRESLAALLSLLFQHEAREMAQLRASGFRGEQASRMLSALEGEHLFLRSLARDIQTLTAHPELYPSDQLARLAGRLPDALEQHIDFEESRVFPAFF